jgi:hypothetical protein
VEYPRAGLEAHPHYKQLLDMGAKAVACDSPVKPGHAQEAFASSPAPNARSIYVYRFADRDAACRGSNAYSIDGPVLWRLEGSKDM